MTSEVAPKLAGLYKPGPSQREAFSLCIYGRSGVGKTTLIGTMPGRGLVVDIPQIEGGTFVLADVSDRIDVKPVTAWDDIDEVYWYILKEKHPYQWLAIDTISAMTQLAIRKTVGERALDMDPKLISQQEWGKVGRLVGELVYKFRTLPIHTIWVGQERQYGGGSEDSPKITGPDTSPAARQMLIPPLLLCARLYIDYRLDGTPERHLRLGPHPDFDAKVRARPGLDVPAVIRNPHLGKLLKYLLGTGERPEEVEEGAIILG